MSRYQSSGAYGFKCHRFHDPYGDYEISWVIDFHYSDSRLRYPRRFTRVTDEAGARRFCKKHNLIFKEPVKSPG